MALFSDNLNNNLVIKTSTNPRNNRPYINLNLPLKDIKNITKRHITDDFARNCKPSDITLLKQYNANLSRRDWYSSGDIYLSSDKAIRDEQLRNIDKVFDNPQATGFWLDNTSVLDLSNNVLPPTQTYLESNSQARLCPQEVDGQTSTSVKLSHFKNSMLLVDNTYGLTNATTLYNLNLTNTNLRASQYNVVDGLSIVSTDDSSNNRLTVNLKNTQLSGHIDNLYATDGMTPITQLTITNTKLSQQSLTSMVRSGHGIHRIKPDLNPLGNNANTICINKGCVVEPTVPEPSLTRKTVEQSTPTSTHTVDHYQPTF